MLFSHSLTIYNLSLLNFTLDGTLGVASASNYISCDNL